MSNIKLLYIDLFCGAGGTSTGVAKARLYGKKCAKVVACVNHDANAIKSHQANHPDTLHFTEDIRTLELSSLVKHLDKMKRKYPDAYVVLWASLECTNFSKANGGQPRDADSRTLAEHLFRYIEAISPDYIQIENVSEFMCWGDLDEEGTSIFAKKKPLCEKTLERIYAGLIKFVAGGKKQHEAWILKYNSMNQQNHHNAPSIEEPCPTVAVQNRLGLVKLNFLSKQFSGDPMSKNQSVEQPAGAVTCVDHHAFVTAYFGNGFNSSIEEPNPTVTTKERHALVSVDLYEPMPDVPLDKVKVMSQQFIANEYSGGGQIGSLEDVCPAILTTPKQKVVTAEQYLMNPYSFKSDGGSINNPCFTLIARMDKMPPYLISTEQGELAIIISEDDTPMTRKIKEFMAMYGIIDIKMRMLNIQELKRIMGFPEDYTLIGTQAEQKKFIGNAVEVNMSRVLCEALAEKLSNYKLKAV